MSSDLRPSNLRLGVDVGGTFTDFALVDDATGRIATHKQLTTPSDPSQSVLSGIDRLLERESIRIADLGVIVHGTTLITNAVIERKGARIGMLVTDGFRDVLDVGMESRYDLFDLRIRYADPVVPRGLRLPVRERMRHDGTIETELDEPGVRGALRSLVEEHRIEALAGAYSTLMPIRCTSSELPRWPRSFTPICRLAAPRR